MTHQNNPVRSLTVAAHDLFVQSATQQHELGTRFSFSDGRVFHYAGFGGTIAAGKTLIAPASVDTHHSMAVTTAAIGSDTLTVTLGATNAVTLDQYKDGYLGLIAGTGLGQLFNVKSHPAAAAAATCVITLKDPLRVATATADTKGDLIYCPFDGVTHSATEESLHVGVSPIAGTSGYFGWIQTWGMCICLSGDTAAEGTLLTADDAAGDVKTQNAYTMDLLGTAVGQAHADGEYNFMFLRLVP